jgi:ATPase subunit of ABC transporter with duplicated ATPase domains
MEISNIMPSSIILSRITLTAPDGRTLVSNIDLTFATERTGLVGRNGVGKTTVLSLIAGDSPSVSGVTVNGTVGLLRQSVQITDGEAIIDLFGARTALAVLRRAEAGEATGDEVAGADWTLERRIAAALASVGLDVSPETPLTRLSGGQATRARLAALIAAGPDFLLLDEPTNNLDRDGRQTVVELLAGWQGGAIIVSHDRELLEGMDVIVELSSLGPPAMAATGASIARANNWSSPLPGVDWRMPRSASLKSIERLRMSPKQKRARMQADVRSGRRGICRAFF